MSSVIREEFLEIIKDMGDFPSWEPPPSSEEFLASISSEYGKMLVASNKGDRVGISKASVRMACLVMKMDEYFGIKTELDIPPVEPAKLFVHVEDKDL